MNYSDNNKNKIRRRKVSSSNQVARPLPRQKNYEKKVEVNTIKKDKGVSKGKRGKKKYKGEKIQKLIKNTLILILLVVASLCAIGSAMVFSVIKDSPTITKDIISNNYISNETISIDNMPKNLKNAMVSIEDERFYEHKGVDIVSITRSILHNILTNTTQGGSTIDMQVSKNLLTNSTQTMERKVQDMYNAIQMNKVMTKEEILEAYLNNIYLGKSAYGVVEGAELYFGKKVQDLTLAQCAMLVGITNNPGKYMEYIQGKKRQETILYKMYELGYITEKEYKEAKREEVIFKSEIE